MPAGSKLFRASPACSNCHLRHQRDTSVDIARYLETSVDMVCFCRKAQNRIGHMALSQKAQKLRKQGLSCQQNDKDLSARKCRYFLFTHEQEELSYSSQEHSFIEFMGKTR